MNIPNNLKYTKDHEWIKVEDNIAFIGITDFAQSEIGNIVFVDIKTDLTELKMGEPFGTIEAVKTVSDLYAPVDGKLIEVNPRINNEPQLINSDPYGDGWIIKIEITNPIQLNELLDAQAYQLLINQ